MGEYRPEVSWVKTVKRRKLIIKASPCKRCGRDCGMKSCTSFQRWFKTSWRELQRYLGNAAHNEVNKA